MASGDEEYEYDYSEDDIEDDDDYNLEEGEDEDAIVEDAEEDDEDPSSSNGRMVWDPVMVGGDNPNAAPVVEGTRFDIWLFLEQ